MFYSCVRKQPRDQNQCDFSLCHCVTLTCHKVLETSQVRISVSLFWPFHVLFASHLLCSKTIKGPEPVWLLASSLRHVDMSQGAGNKSGQDFSFTFLAISCSIRIPSFVFENNQGTKTSVTFRFVAVSRWHVIRFWKQVRKEHCEGGKA